MNFKFLILFLLGSLLVNAQSDELFATHSMHGNLFDKVQEAMKNEVPDTYNIIETANEDLKSLDLSLEQISKGIIIDLDYGQINTLKSTNSECIQLSFPLPDKGPVTVNLVRNKVLTNDFIFRTSSDLGIISKYEPGKYYNGVISNDPNSVVSISIFENEVMGFISNSNGNYVIGKLKDTKGNKHIIYNDADLVNSIDFDCYTENDGYVYSMEELTFDGGGNKTVGDCIRVYIEIDDDIVTDKGGAVGATNYVTGLFNEVITLYENDGINMVINEILAWDTPAPYSGVPPTKCWLPTRLILEHLMEI